MASSIRLPTAGSSYRLTAMLSGSGAGFSMGLILCLCGGLIACFAVLSAQMRQPAQAVGTPPEAAAATADEVFNARYYPLIDCPRFRMPRRRLVWFPDSVTLPYPNPEILPTGGPCPKAPLYPVSFSAASLSPMPAAEVAPAPEVEK